MSDDDLVRTAIELSNASNQPLDSVMDALCRAQAMPTVVEHRLSPWPILATLFFGWLLGVMFALEFLA